MLRDRILTTALKDKQRPGYLGVFGLYFFVIFFFSIKTHSLLPRMSTSYSLRRRDFECLKIVRCDSLSVLETGE